MCVLNRAEMRSKLCDMFHVWLCFDISPTSQDVSYFSSFLGGYYFLSLFQVTFVNLLTQSVILSAVKITRWNQNHHLVEIWIFTAIIRYLVK